MKSLAFFCSVILAVFPALAGVTSDTTTSFGASAATGPNWSAAMQKFSRESADSSHEAVATRLLIDHLFDNDLVAKAASAASAAALAPAAGASAAAGKPGESQAAFAGATPSDFDKSGADEDWATSVRHSIRDIVKPYQEFLPGSSDTSSKPVTEGASSGQLQGSHVSGGSASARKSEERRRAENVQSEYLISQLIDELLPWAVGAGVLVALGYGLTFWVGFVKNKPSARTVKSSRSRSRKKRHRTSI